MTLKKLDKLCNSVAQRHSLLFAVLITTLDRPELLMKRALASVAGQTRQPDLVVIADDSTPANIKKNKSAVARFKKKTDVPVIHLDGQQHFRGSSSPARSSGGFDGGGHNRARNDAALAVLARGFPATKTWIAVLDDDDEWLPHHLAETEATIKSLGKKWADFVPAPYEYRHPNKSEKIRLSPKLNGREFLVGNPGVEGSTFVVRLSAFLRAGMFDESLSACDDRDLCFSLSLLKDLKFKQPAEISAVYHNDPHERITKWRGDAQLKGLSRFAEKYRGWMTEEEYRAFCKRARKLFGWHPQDGERFALAPKTRKEIPLVVGLIVPENVNEQLFEDILKLSSDNRLSSTDMVIVPCSGGNDSRLSDLAEKWRHAGLRIHCLKQVDINKIARELNIVADLHKRSIAVNRTILLHAVHRVGAGVEGNSLDNPVFWILDGDVRLHALEHKNGKLTKTIPDYVGEIIFLRNSGHDVSVGSINGSAPLPRALTVRTQMVDLMHFFERLCRPSNTRHFPTTIADWSNANISSDYYHDCGDHPHLEQPIGLPPLSEHCSQRQFVQELPSLVERVLAGDAVTRPLLNGAAGRGKLHRGGNTLIFRAEILRQCPNGFIHTETTNIRRQDEIWRIIGESLGWKIHSGFSPVTQTRIHEPAQAPDMGRVRADIVGHAVSTALRDAIGVRKFRGIGELKEFLKIREKHLLDKAKELAEVRAAKIQASFFRVSGIAESIRGRLAEKSCCPETKKADIALNKMQKSFSREALMMDNTSSENAVTVLRTATANLTNLFQESTGSEHLKEWLREECKKNAIRLISKISPSIESLKFLGSGGEGTVYADKHNVYKVIHQWYSRKNVSDPNFMPSILHSHKGRDDDSAIYRITDKLCKNGDLLIVMTYETTRPYKGGHAVGLVTMLKEFKKCGVCLWDIKPKNLRFNKNGQVRLIDYGQHIQPFHEWDFELSVRKAWLCWRYGDRKGMQKTRTATLTTNDMPELKGYENMKKAIEELGELHRNADTAVDEILSGRPKRILDFGCGDGKTAAKMAQSGAVVCAYDPALPDEARQTLSEAKIRIVSKRQLSKERSYDAILLRHVICEISSDEELFNCLHTIRRLVAKHGKVVITACDMDRVVKEKLYATNHMPTNANSRQKFLYKKEIRKNGSLRDHVHRPRKTLEKLFLHAGFEIMSVDFFSDIDIEKFKPCGGVLQWTLKPAFPQTTNNTTKKAKSIRRKK